jgi:hypothetical protein
MSDNPDEPPLQFAPEAHGNDFLNTDLAGINYTTHGIKAAVNNVLQHFGSEKPKQRTEAHVQMQVSEFLNMIPFAAKLTKNLEQNVACPVDVDTIRNYDLKAKDYVLPPYVASGTNTLHATFIALCEESYNAYQEANEKQFKKECPNGRYMQTTSWKSKLEPPLAEITRFLIKYWHLHPHLNREQAVQKGTDYVCNNFKKKGDLKRLIQDILEGKRRDGYKEDLLALETEAANYDGEEVKVFKENESAQTVIANYLISVDFKWDKKETMDMVEPLHKYIDSLDEAKKPVFAKFDGMVPKQTALYLDKVNKRAQKEEAAKQKAKVREEKEKENQLKKKQKLDDTKKKLQEKSDKQKEKEKDDAMDLDDEEEQQDGVVAQEGVMFDLDALEGENPEHNLPVGVYNIINAVDAGGKRSSRKAKQDNVDQFAKITKVLESIESDGTVKVSYTRPGVVWQRAIAKRLTNISGALMSFAIDEPTLVQQCMPIDDDVHDDKRKFDIKSGRVILAVILHEATQSGDLKKIKLVSWFNEANFVRDLAHTQKLWLPAIFSSSDIAKLECFYDLILSRHDILGQSKKDRVQALDQWLSVVENISHEKGQQVNEIIQLLNALKMQLDDERVSNGQTKAVDPWNTKCRIYDK